MSVFLSLIPFITSNYGKFTFNDQVVICELKSKKSNQIDWLYFFETIFI